MSQTLIALFDTRGAAENAAHDLLNNGVPRTDISLITRDNIERSDLAESETRDAPSGAAIGGVLGLIGGVAVLVIPGVGPVIAAGPLVAALGTVVAGAGAGAAAGGLLGALTNAGVPEDQAHVYSEGVRRGGTLVAVATDSMLGSAVYELLQRHNPVDVNVRRNELLQSGWERFDSQNTTLSEGTQERAGLREDWEESSKVGTATGAAAGAATGAALGAVAGPVGSIIGGIAGAAVGGGVGAAGDVAGKEAENITRENEE